MEKRGKECHSPLSCKPQGDEKDENGIPNFATIFEGEAENREHVNKAQQALLRLDAHRFADQEEGTPSRFVQVSPDVLTKYSQHYQLSA